jgi:integrase
MSVERHSDGRYRYRATGYYSDGTSCRISGSAPKNENTRAAAARKETEHLAWLATQMPPPKGDPNPTPPATPAAAVADPPAAPAEPPKPAVPTLAEFAPVYLASVRLDNAFSTVRTKEDKFEMHLVPHLGHLRLDEIDYAAIDTFRVALAATCDPRVRREIRTLKGKTVNGILDLLGHVLEFARRRGAIAVVPDIPRVKVVPPKFDFLTFEELDRLIAAADGVWRAMIIVAARTGLRRGELLGLRHEDVDTRSHQLNVWENYVRFRFGMPKSGKARQVPLSMHAEAALLSERHSRGKRVFCDALGKPFTQGVMEYRIAQACRRAGLRRIGWHVLRHTFASHLVMRGVHIRAVQELMGHSSMVITQRYAHLAPHVSQGAVRLLDGPGEPPATERPRAEPPKAEPRETEGASADQPALSTTERSAA